MPTNTTYNAPVVNPPAVMAAGVFVAAVDLLGGASLVAGAKYLVTLKNALAADRAGALWEPIIEGWIKTSNAIDVVAQGGIPISSDTPVEISSVTGKLRLSFWRSDDTPYYSVVYVCRIDS